jgi:predicted HD phosphohydrolase
LGCEFFAGEEIFGRQDVTAQATFAHIGKSTPEDWAAILGELRPYAATLADRVLDHLKVLEDDWGGLPVARLTHCLQTATLAHRDGRDEEYVVCALLHDIGDTLGSYNHPDIAAAMLKPFVSPENVWMVQPHGVFQGYYFFQNIGLDPNMREQFRDQPELFERTAEFCEKYDAPAFDKDYDTLSLSFFEPMVRRVFAKPRHSMYDKMFRPAE